MTIYYLIIIFATVDITGRVLTLIYMMKNSEVKTLTYRTWVLLVAFLNFAFIFYWAMGKKFT